MKYAQHRSSFSEKKRKMPWKYLGILLGFFIVLIVVLLIRGCGSSPPAGRQGSLDVDDPTVILSDSEGSLASDEAIEYQEIELFATDGSDSYGTSRRGTSGNLFTHVIVADLPMVDTESYFYEGWLVKPGVTDFFSTGEVFARADGKWGLVWEVKLDDAVQNLEDFTNVVITLEPQDDDPAPSADHILEGEF